MRYEILQTGAIYWPDTQREYQVEPTTCGQQHVTLRKAEHELLSGLVNLADAESRATFAAQLNGMSDAVRAELDGLAALAERAEIDSLWAERQSFPPVAPVVPPLPVELLPIALRDWIVDVSERGSVPIESVAVAAVVGLGAVVGRQIGICPGRLDDYMIVPNLWGMDIDRPGAQKSWRVAEGLKPLRQLAARARDEFETHAAEAAATLERIDAELGSLRKAMSRAAEDGEEDTLLNLEARLFDKQAEHEAARVIERRYVTHDATVEKLGELLRDNPRGLLVYRDELAGLLKALNKPGREGDREFFLEAWNGTGSYTSDRIGRGTTHIDAVCISLFGTIQPGKLRRYIDEALGRGTGADGLLPRFQLLVYPETVPWQAVDRAPDAEAFKQALDVYRWLDNLDPNSIAANTSGEVPVLRFDAEAQILFDAFRDELEARLRSDDLASMPAFEAHLAKYRSLLPTLALLFHLVDVAAGAPPGPVSFDAARRAAAWCEYLELHLRKVYIDEVGADLQRAHALADRIEAGDIVDGMSLRDIYRNHWQHLRTANAVRSGMKVLESVGWTRLTLVPSETGRPTEIVRIHPDLRGSR